MNGNVLKLTGIIQGVDPGVFVGRIKEITGIISQGETEEEAYENLKQAARDILEYKRKEALDLLAKQQAKPKVETNAKLDFVLAKA